MAKPKLPPPIRLWIIATGFEHAADAAYNKLKTPKYCGFIITAVVFLYARVIELSLKACLRQRVAEYDVYKKLGHRIDRIMKKADEFAIGSALGMTQAQRDLIATIGEDYADKWFEYPDTLWKAKPDLEELRATAKFLTAATRIYVDPKNNHTA